MIRLAPKPHLSTIAASSLIVAGLAGTLVDNNGRVGLALFAASAVGALFLIVRRLVRSVPSVRSLRRPVPRIVGTRVVAVAVVAMGVLLSATNVFKATDSDLAGRIVNYAAWTGFLLIATGLVVVAGATAVGWLRAKPAA